MCLCDIRLYSLMQLKWPFALAHAHATCWLITRSTHTHTLIRISGRTRAGGAREHTCLHITTTAHIHKSYEFRTQAGGARELRRLDGPKALVAKPCCKREAWFYRCVTGGIRDFAPKYHGIKVPAMCWYLIFRICTMFKVTLVCAYSFFWYMQHVCGHESDSLCKYFVQFGSSLRQKCTIECTNLWLIWYEDVQLVYVHAHTRIHTSIIQIHTMCAHTNMYRTYIYGKCECTHMQDAYIYSIYLLTNIHDACIYSIYVHVRVNTYTW